MRFVLVLASALTFCLTGFAASQAPVPPQAPPTVEPPPAAPPAPKGVVCGPEGCRVRATNGFTVVQTPAFGPLPEGYRWVPTAQGHGCADPWGEWNNAPSASNTERLNTGYFYTPMPGRDPYPRGFWVSPCVKDSDCRVVACNVPPVGQHGEPTVANAQSLAAARDTFHPNDYQGGYRRVLKEGCEGGTCALPPAAWTTAAPPKQAPACSYCSDCKCKSGQCPSQCPLSYADACARVAKGERVYLSVGKRVETVKVCQSGTCRMVPVTAHTDALKGFADGVYECYLLNGSPVMQLLPR